MFKVYYSYGLGFMVNRVLGLGFIGFRVQGLGAQIGGYRNYIGDLIEITGRLYSDCAWML